MESSRLRGNGEDRLSGGACRRLLVGWGPLGTPETLVPMG